MKWGVRRTKEQLGYRAKGSLNKTKLGQLSGEELEKYRQHIKALSGKIDSMADMPKIQGSHSIEEDLTAVNPKYGRSLGYINNCGNCVTAFELRRRGFDVEALPRNLMVQSVLRQIFKGIEMKDEDGVDNKRLPQLRKKIADWGDGARGVVVTLSLDENSDQVGHIFSTITIDGKAKFVDPQNPKADIETHMSNAKYTWASRVDNLEITEEALSCVKKRIQPSEPKKGAL